MQYIVDNLPPLERQTLRQGGCPWCLGPVFDNKLCGGAGDMCPDCGDTFVSRAELPAQPVPDFSDLDREGYIL